MPTKMTSTGITFPDNSTQSTAGGPVTTQYAIGSYIFGRPANAESYNNSTIAGSSLYSTSPSYIYRQGFSVESNSNFSNATSIYGVGQVNSLINTGSWRCVSIAGRNTSGGFDPGYEHVAYPGLWVRYA